MAGSADADPRHSPYSALGILGFVRLVDVSSCPAVSRSDALVAVGHRLRTKKGISTVPPQATKKPTDTRLLFRACWQTHLMIHAIWASRLASATGNSRLLTQMSMHAIAITRNLAGPVATVPLVSCCARFLDSAFCVRGLLVMNGSFRSCPGRFAVSQAPVVGHPAFPALQVFTLRRTDSVG